MTDAFVRMYESGFIDIEYLELAATVAWQPWEALNEVAPERATKVPRPKRPRGRDPLANLLRDTDILDDVEWRVLCGESQHEAFRAIAEKHRMLTPGAIGAAYRKARKEKDGDA